MNDLVPIQMRKFENEIMFNFTPPPHVANGHCLESIKIIATRK